ncbi:TlpA family protein disulfide reductase [Mucilaginibacter glaciei]|uniref:TlpA family protein disulfide reductase n=1 Tax=Mucilaginibacter glaciei TaxID=2772109 RepID=A0A926S1E8_9SPHI|nr:TlpA disulfide reductase family protein [Mucilaginibacter glaciei]MBD1392727.1 TlpA family protein disulfide reductase [Mucilaginibacter glaciei]
MAADIATGYFKKVYFVATLCLLCFFDVTFGNVRISGEFMDKKGVEKVWATVPVGSFNNYIYDVYYPVTNNKFAFDIPVTTMVTLQIKTGFGRIFLFVAPGDDIKIKIYNTTDKSKALVFEGSNAAGQYAYNVYNSQPLATRMMQSALFAALEEKDKYRGLKKFGSFIGRQTSTFDVLYKEGKINIQFLSLVKTDIRAEQGNFLIGQLTYLQSKITDSSKKLRYQEYKNALMEFAGPNKLENARCGFGVGYLADYYFDKAGRIKLPNDKDWGSYGAYKLAPKPIQEYLFGNMLMFAKLIGLSEFDYKKTLPIYKKEFPNSPYLAFLDTVKGVNSLVNAADVKIDTLTKFKNFNQLKRYFSGKAIYVDLWATWCMPCRGEFPSYAQLRPLLKKKKVTPVFISVDAPKARQVWKDIVRKSKLEGYNMMVDKVLMADLVKQLYKNGLIEIPRYILVDKYGKVISLDAPRPSNPDLKKMLAKL